MVAATLNRTLKSFALAIVGAEYVLRWLPRGTHQWDKFVTPERARDRARARAACGVHRRDRRDLQSARRPLAALVRHGRELHGDGGSAAAMICSRSWLWAVFTLIAAAAQTVRNATQRELTATLGTVGATHVRFLFGLAVRVLFLLGVRRARRRGAAAAGLDLTGRGCWTARCADRRHRADARRHGRALVRGRDRLHQDRAGAGGAVRARLPRRPRHAADGARDPASRPPAWC